MSKTFDLRLPKLGEKNPKIHPISHSDFKAAARIVSQAAAERAVELGYGKWAPGNTLGEIIVPQSLYAPEQYIFVRQATGTVKAVHVNSLVKGLGPVPADFEVHLVNLSNDANFEHDPADTVDPEEYEKECVLNDTEGAVDVKYDEPEDAVEEIVQEDPDVPGAGDLDDLPQGATQEPGESKISPEEGSGTSEGPKSENEPEKAPEKQKAKKPPAAKKADDKK